MKKTVVIIECMHFKHNMNLCLFFIVFEILRAMSIKGNGQGDPVPRSKNKGIYIKNNL